MRILFVIPPYFKLYGSFNNRINVGMHSLAEVLCREEYPVSILNLDHSDELKPLATRAEILLNSSKIDSESVTNSITKLFQHIKKFKPSHIVISFGDNVVASLDSGDPEISILIADKIRRKSPDLFIAGYGPLVRKNPNFDLLLSGYGEEKISFLLKNRVKGLRYSTISSNVLNKLPFLTLDYMENKIHARDFDYIHQTRGCTFGCKFCLSPIASKKKVISSSPKRFVDEIEFRYKTYNVKNFYFCDMNFNRSTNILKRTCNELIERKLDISWRCECRLDLITEYQVEMLLKAGCSYVKVGIEAMNDERLKYFGKKLTVNKILQQVKVLNKKGLKFVVYIILGHPNYSYKKYMEEFELFKALKADKYTVSILNPPPGVPLYKHLSRNKTENNSISHLDRNLAKYWNISSDVIKKYFELELTHGREDGNVRNFNTKLDCLANLL